MAISMTSRLSELTRGTSPDIDEDNENFANEGFFSTVDEMSTDISKIEAKLVDISKVQDDIITKPPTASKGIYTL
jgi:hypothetical protein